MSIFHELREVASNVSAICAVPSDTGIPLNIWDNEVKAEKAVVFAFKA